jgi:hypothetical protein
VIQIVRDGSVQDTFNGQDGCVHPRQDVLIVHVLAGRDNSGEITRSPAVVVWDGLWGTVVLIILEVSDEAISIEHLVKILSAWHLLADGCGRVLLGTS